jgi:hypothetical protein
MRTRSVAACVWAALALAAALPASAVAQNAGDEQYVDPFENQQQGGGGSGGGSDGSGSEGSGQPAAQPPAPEPVEPAAPTTSAAPDATLPVTGVPAGLLAGAGGALLAAGAALRRRL